MTALPAWNGGFVAGATAAVRGVFRAAGNRQVWRAYVRLSLVLVLFIGVVEALALWGVWHWTSGDVDTSRWAAAGLVAARVTGLVLVLLAAPVVGLLLAHIVLPFLGVHIFLAGLRAQDPDRAAELEASPGLPFVRSVLYGVARLLLFLGSALLALLATFIPGIGFVVGPALQLYVAARALGWELLDPYFDRQLADLRTQRRFVSRERVTVIAFALPYVLLLSIPLVGPLAFGLAQAAAASLVTDVEVRSPRGDDGPLPLPS